MARPRVDYSLLDEVNDDDENQLAYDNRRRGPVRAASDPPGLPSKGYQPLVPSTPLKVYQPTDYQSYGYQPDNSDNINYDRSRQRAMSPPRTSSQPISPRTNRQRPISPRSNRRQPMNNSRSRSPPREPVPITPRAFFYKVRSQVKNGDWPGLNRTLRELPNEIGSGDLSPTSDSIEASIGEHILWHEEQGHVLAGLTEALVQYFEDGYALQETAAKKNHIVRQGSIKYVPFQFDRGFRSQGITLKEVLQFREAVADAGNKRAAHMSNLENVIMVETILQFDNIIGQLSQVWEPQANTYMARRAGRHPEIFTCTAAGTSDTLKFVYMLGYDPRTNEHVLRATTSYSIIPHRYGAGPVGRALSIVLWDWRTHHGVGVVEQERLLHLLDKNADRFVNNEVLAINVCGTSPERLRESYGSNEDLAGSK